MLQYNELAQAQTTAPPQFDQQGMLKVDQGFTVKPTPTVPSTALSQPVSDFDLKSMMSSYQKRTDDLFKSFESAFTPTMEEQAMQQNNTNLQTQYNNLANEIEQDTLNTNEQLAKLGGVRPGVPAAVATAQQNEVARQAQQRQAALAIRQNAVSRQQQVALQTLQNSQESRRERLKAAEFLYNANRNSLEDSIKMYQMTQPQNLSFQVNKATGEGIAVMKNPVTGEVYTKNVGRVTSPDLNTQVVEVGKRKLLIDAQTGNVIRDLGASPSSSSSGGIDFGSFLSGVGPNANNDSIKAAAAQMVTYLPSTQQKAFAGNIERLLKEGKTKEAANSLVTSAINLVGEASTREKLRGKYIAIKQLDQIETLLEQFKQAGGDTNILNGSLEKISQKVGNTSNQQLAYIWGRIRTSIVDYRRAVSGAAFTESERKEYAALFPDISKSRKLNEAALRSLRDSFNTDLEATLETILGTGNYQALQTTINGDPLANYVNQVNNVSVEEQYAAALTGEVQQQPIPRQPKTTTQTSSGSFFGRQVAPMFTNSVNAIKRFFGGN